MMKFSANQNASGNPINRRKFILNTGKVIGTSLVLASPLVGTASGLFKLDEAITVGQIMDLFIREVPGGAKANTVDTLKSGSREIKVTGIVTTMFATIELIRNAISLGANFIIAHEPTFYNHTDETNWLENDDVYQYKSNLLKQHNIAVWRNHDYVHSLKIDGVQKGVVEQLGWQNFGNPNQDLYQLKPVQTLTELIQYVKQKLNIKMLRYVGNSTQPCQKVLLMPGASGGRNQISAIMKTKPDVLICGEISEWETAEYVRDANAKGDQLALIVLGHIASEEPGSAFMAQWLKEKFPQIKTTHVPPGNSLSFL